MKVKCKTVNKKAAAALKISFGRLLNKEYSKRQFLATKPIRDKARN